MAVADTLVRFLFFAVVNNNGVKKLYLNVIFCGKEANVGGKILPRRLVQPVICYVFENALYNIRDGTRARSVPRSSRTRDAEMYSFRFPRGALEQVTRNTEEGVRELLPEPPGFLSKPSPGKSPFTQKPCDWLCALWRIKSLFHCPVCGFQNADPEKMHPHCRKAVEDGTATDTYAFPEGAS